jgi:putative ABC transport system permease protein
VNGWLVALRIARREARRAKGRSMLVVALIGLPVLALAAAAVAYDMFELTPAERVTRDIGAADAQLRWEFGGPIQQSGVRGDGIYSPGGVLPDGEPPMAGAAEIEAVLPPGSAASPRYQGLVWLDTVGGVGELYWHAFDLAGPVTDGLARLVDGRPPAPGDVALTAAAAERLGLGIGDTLEADGRSYTVTGTVQFPGVRGQHPDFSPGPRDEVVLFHPDTRPGNSWPVRWLVDTPTPVTWDDVRTLNELGILVYSRAVALDPPPEVAADRRGPSTATFQTGVVVAGLAAIEIVLLAGPAFAVGARRRQRDLALIAAGGGTPAHLRRIVLADGVVLASVAAVAGLALGITAALAARHWVGPQLFGALPGGYRVYPLALLGILGFAIGTGLLAALVPAFTAARQQVVDALAGRRGARGFRRRWLVVGLVTTMLGAGVAGVGAWHVTAQVVVAGLVLGQLGLVLCTPAVIGLAARLGNRLPLAPRMALRDTARNRSAAAPAISAVMAAVAGAVTIGVVWVSFDAQYAAEANGDPYPAGTVTAAIHDGFDGSPPADAATVERIARESLPVDDVQRLHDAVCDEESGGCMLVVAVPEQHRCPYQRWDPERPMSWNVPELSPAEQRDASRDPRCAGNHALIGYDVDIDDGRALPVITGMPGDQLAPATAILRAGGAVVTDERYLSDGLVTLFVIGHDERGTFLRTEFTVPGHLLDGGPRRDGAILSPAALSVAGLDAAPRRLVMSTTRTPTQEEQDAFDAAIRQLGSWAWVSQEPGRDTDPVVLLLAAVAAVIALGAAAIATGLSAADRRGDLSTLGAVGAGPTIRRGMSLSQSGVIAGLGTMLGLGAGLGASTAVLFALNQRYAGIWPSPPPFPITVPWMHLSALLLVPVVAMLGAGLLTRSRLPVERRFG